MCDLFFFIPGKVYKQKNDSENLYLIMSSMARRNASILAPNHKILKHEEQQVKVLTNKFWVKLQQKFGKLGDMFRYFDRNYDNSISYKEFRVVCDELDLRFSEEETKLLFNYLDKDKEGTIGYHEFITISEDTRLGMNPKLN